MCQKMCKAQNVQKQHFQGLANQVPVKECARVFCVCQSVVPASPGLFRPRGLAQPCPAFHSLLQLTPARSGPRSFAQLPRGPGRVPIIQGASQRSYRVQEPWQCPGMCLGGVHGHIYLQPIGTVPRLKNYIFTVSENTWKNSKLNIFISFIWHLKVKVLFLHLCHRKSAILDFYFLSAMFVYKLHFLSAILVL